MKACSRPSVRGREREQERGMGSRGLAWGAVAPAVVPGCNRLTGEVGNCGEGRVKVYRDATDQGWRFRGR